MPYASGRSTGKSQDRRSIELLPADVIVRDLEDSRGWFYALVVLGHKLFNAAPFRNAIIPGILRPNDVLYPQKNYAPPTKSLSRYGADAMRLYFVSSPVMQGKTMMLRDGGMAILVSQIVLPVWHLCRYMGELMLNFKKSTNNNFVAQIPIQMDKQANVTDRWILSCCQRLIQFVDREMRGMHPPLSRHLRVSD